MITFSDLGRTRSERKSWKPRTRWTTWTKWTAGMLKCSSSVLLDRVFCSAALYSCTMVNCKCSRHIIMVMIVVPLDGWQVQFPLIRYEDLCCTPQKQYHMNFWYNILIDVRRSKACVNGITIEPMRAWIRIVVVWAVAWPWGFQGLTPPHWLREKEIFHVEKCYFQFF